ncbi:MAG: phosphoribosylformylglycinamidine synthase PurS subunit [Paracoccaceae bacterium]|jgi:phosphoribosylformylglycinamidine synthase PurS subunit
MKWFCGGVMKVRVNIMPKKGVLDPQGEAIKNALLGLGFSEVKEIRQGKLIDIEINESRRSIAEPRVTQMCEKLLANSVIESFSVEIP